MMGFDYTVAPVSTVFVETAEGPYTTTDGNRFLWLSVSVQFGQPNGLTPEVRFLVAVDITGDKIWSEIEQEAFDRARELFRHAGLEGALS